MQWGCVGGCHCIGYDGEGSGLEMWFCAGRSIGRSFAMGGVGVRGMLVFQLSLLARCIDSLMSQNNMLTYDVWLRM